MGRETGPIKTNEMKATATKNVYMTIDQFDRDLETCLLIVSEPSKQYPYYVCEKEKSIIYVYIVK